MKNKIFIIITIVISLILCVIFILLTTNKESEGNIGTIGKINIIEQNTQLSNEEQIELEQNISGDAAIVTDNTPILICHISDVNNTIIGSNYLPLISMASYHSTISDYLKKMGFDGVLNLTVIDDSIYKVDNIYYFSFFIEEANKTLSCSYDELKLSYDLMLY